MAAWDGQGAPPSLDAAVAWFATQTGLNKTQARKYLTTGSGTEFDAKGGNKVGGAAWWGENTRQMVPRLQKDLANPLIRAQLVKRGVVGSENQARQLASRMGAQQAQAPVSDEQAAAVRDATGIDPNAGGLDALIAGGPDAGADAVEDPFLLPYEVAEPDTFTLPNQSRTGWGRGRDFTVNPMSVPERTAPRYRASALEEPTNWSKEKIAALQREMIAAGAYPKGTQVKLGYWYAEDIEAWGALLTAANVEGRTWRDQIKEWKIRPPTDTQEKQPTFRPSNPLDIKEAASGVSQRLTGGGNAAWTQAAVGAWQARERQQFDAEVAADAIGGGTVEQLPDINAYLADKMRREMPVEVAGQGFMEGFNVLRSMVGL